MNTLHFTHTYLYSMYIIIYNIICIICEYCILEERQPSTDCHTMSINGEFNIVGVGAGIFQ